MSRLIFLYIMIIAVALLITTGAYASGFGAEEPNVAPLSSAFKYYKNGTSERVLTAAGVSMPNGLVPEPIDLSIVNTLPNASDRVTTASLVGSLPSNYDLRSSSKLNPIRNQGSCGSCWCFASYASLESYLLPTQTKDFSENNLNYHHGFTIPSCDGGNRLMASAYMARWSGPVSESDDPYGGNSPTDTTASMHVQDIIFVANRTSSLDNDSIKEAVMTYGAVYSTYYHSDTYYNSSKASYYYNGSTYANHAVSIVGWDDNYSSANFRSTPAGNGAFIVRNSWGTGWGNAGYFYVSYYDSRFGRDENAVFTAEPSTNYSRIYQYDTLGWVTSSGYGNQTAWFANVFTAAEDSEISAASWYSASPGSSYQMYVYLSPTSGPKSSSVAATTSGTFEAAGYHTVKLSTPVAVSQGQKFSIVVRLTTPGYTYPIPLEAPEIGYSEKASADSGQSYMSSSGTTWSDVAGYFPDTNVCLKAFTMEESVPPPTPTPSEGTLAVTGSSGFISSGYVGGSFSPTKCTYILTNTGASDFNWSASKTKSWVTLSAIAGSLSAGASTTVDVTINAAANALTSGSHSDIVTFTNTTNGNGNTTRAVALTVEAIPSDPGILSVNVSETPEFSGTAGGPFGPAGITYTLTNTGGSAIKWAAARDKTWITLSAVSGTLAAGATTTVQASINSQANALTVGNYTGAVFFGNITNDDGTTAKLVNLSVGEAPPAVSIYSVESTAYSWISSTKHKKISIKSGVSSAISLPFAFTYYGQEYTQFYIGKNGLLGFVNSGLGSSANRSIPDQASPDAAIYPYWDSFNSGSVRVGTVGTAPNRKVVVSWCSMPHSSYKSSKFTFQAVLCEGSNDIVFQYQKTVPTNANVGAGNSATIGIESVDGEQALQWSYNSMSVADKSALRFYSVN